jgi:hypothetical protein
MIAMIGSKSDSGKTTACFDLIKLFYQNGNKVGVAKLSGTARRGELLKLTNSANQWLDYRPHILLQDTTKRVRH